MIDVLVLRFDAPLMSFGSVVVDQQNMTDPLPYRAMLTGLVANALGWTRHEEAALASLQQRLRYAARRDRAGSPLVDYQTVDFDPAGPSASDLGWTTHGRLEERKGGEAGDGTHIRYRHYLADTIITVAVTLDPAGEAPTLDVLAEALVRPARPLFLGRKCCVPSRPVFLGRVQNDSLRGALAEVPRARGADAGELLAVWPSDEGGDPDSTLTWARVEDRDWVNSIHVGRRSYTQGVVSPPGATDA